ncbi:hypothetical protein, partial [Micromonospora sp. NPDC057140]
MRIGNTEIRPAGGGLGCLLMILFSVVASIVLTVRDVFALHPHTHRSRSATERITSHRPQPFLLRSSHWVVRRWVQSKDIPCAGVSSSGWV